MENSGFVVIDHHKPLQLPRIMGSGYYFGRLEEMTQFHHLIRLRRSLGVTRMESQETPVPGYLDVAIRLLDALTEVFEQGLYIVPPQIVCHWMLKDHFVGTQMRPF